MFCQKCGKQLSEGSMFCNFCGTQLQPLAALPAQDVSNPRAGKDLMLGGLFVFILCFTVFLRNADNSFVRTMGIIGAIIGVGMMIWGKVQHWYQWE